MKSWVAGVIVYLSEMNKKGVSSGLTGLTKITAWIVLLKKSKLCEDLKCLKGAGSINKCQEL